MYVQLRVSFISLLGPTGDGFVTFPTVFSAAAAAAAVAAARYRSCCTVQLYTVSRSLIPPIGVARVARGAVSAVA